MKIGIASDHRGYKLKTKLIKYLEKKYEVIDYGADTDKKLSDYTKYGFILGEAINKDEINFGIAICGSGIGISIACNKVMGVRCAKVDSIKDAKLSRRDNDANVMAISGTTKLYKAKDLVDAFLKTKFSGIDRYIDRINQINDYEKGKE